MIAHMAAYPTAPEGWSEVDRTRVGPFTTHVTFRRPDGAVAEWSSRLHRKRASLLSRARERHRVWWAPDRASWWIGVLFAIGSTCFFIGPFPGFVELVGSRVDGIVFFVGSIFFTTAAGLQFLESMNADEGPDGVGRRRFGVRFQPHRIDWWSCATQFVGTLLFNRSTFHAMQAGLDTNQYDKLVWRPDLVGSALFLISGYLAYVEVGGSFTARPRRSLESRIASVNLLGCIAFGISAVAAYAVPSTGSTIDLAAANFFTALGGLCFLIGALLMLPEGASEAEPNLGEVPQAAGSP
jgi:hypothetical protein